MMMLEPQASEVPLLVLQPALQPTNALDQQLTVREVNDSNHNS
jgi:hypothetical protein